MTTQAKPLRCGICGYTRGMYILPGYFGTKTYTATGNFTKTSILVSHKRLVHYEEYKASKAQGRITRESRLRQEAEAAAEAEARMVAASERVIEKEHNWNWKSTFSFAMVLTYQVHTDDYHLPTYRRPTPEALAHIQSAELALEQATANLEIQKAAAWETGAPVTKAQVLAARAGGEVTE